MTERPATGRALLGGIKRSTAIRCQAPRLSSGLEQVDADAGHQGRCEAPTMSVGESIGQRLRRLRLEKGLSQRALAGPGVSYAYVSRIEGGQRRPSLRAIRVLARKLGVSAQYLETGSMTTSEEDREIRLSDAELRLRLDESVAGAEDAFQEVLRGASEAGGGGPADPPPPRPGLSAPRA